MGLGAALRRAPAPWPRRPGARASGTQARSRDAPPTPRLQLPGRAPARDPAPHPESGSARKLGPRLSAPIFHRGRSDYAGAPAPRACPDGCTAGAGAEEVSDARRSPECGASPWLRLATRPRPLQGQSDLLQARRDGDGTGPRGGRRLRAKLGRPSILPAVALNQPD